MFFSSKRAVDENEVEAAERQNLRCVWVTGGRALTEQEAAIKIVSEARLLLQEDLAQLGVHWDPATLPPGAPALNSPGDHSRDPSSALSLSLHEGHKEKIKGHQDGERGKTIENRCGKENKAEYKHEKRMKMEKTKQEAKREQVKSKPEDSLLNIKIKEHRQEDRAEPTTQRDNEAHVGGCKKTKRDETNKKMLVANDQGKPNEKTEEEKSEGIRSDSHQVNRPVSERSLTQELAEILSSPLPQLMPLPEPSSSPVATSQFRAPMSRAEEQHSGPTRIQNGGTTGLVASPAQQDRQKHLKALSKVLHSIQTDKSLQGNIQVTQTLRSKPTGVPFFQDPVPAGQVPTTVPALGPLQETPAHASSPTKADMQNSTLLLSSVSAPSFSPEAKRRRINVREADKFSSPELYIRDERDDSVEGAVTKEGESFGDSFELDTQTERIISQEASQHRDGNDGGMNQPVEAEKIREEEMVVANVELDKDINKGSNRFEVPGNACPRFNISLTDSQMELILNTSHQVSPHNLMNISFIEMASLLKNKSCCFYRFQLVQAVRMWLNTKMKVVMKMGPSVMISLPLKV